MDPLADRAFVIGLEGDDLDAELLAEIAQLPVDFRQRDRAVYLGSRLPNML
jgi:hypothetical protein